MSVAQNMVVLFKDEQCLGNTRPLYKQKFFVINLPILLEQFRKSTDFQETIYLTAISNLLKYLPTSVLLSELPQILPILLESTKVPITPGTSNVLQLAAVNTMIMLVQEVPNTVGNHLGTLIPRLLDMSRNENSPLNLRKSSITCLSVLTRLPYIQLHPYKQQVLRELKKPLDDKKRDVRKVAVRTRNEWFTIGFAAT